MARAPHFDRASAASVLSTEADVASRAARCFTLSATTSAQPRCGSRPIVAFVAAQTNFASARTFGPLKCVLRENFMVSYQVAVIVGSLRKGSFNRTLALAVARLAPPTFRFEHVLIADLPLYNQDDDKNPAASVVRLKAQVSAAQGLLFVTPEYNRSIPGVLKNAIDHASRPYGQSAWAGKAAGILGASVGAIGTAPAQQHLRSILGCLDVATMGQPEAFVHAKEGFFDAEGNVGGATRKFMQGWMDRYVAWVKWHND